MIHQIKQLNKILKVMNIIRIRTLNNTQLMMDVLRKQINSKVSFKNLAKWKLKILKITMAIKIVRAHKFHKIIIPYVMKSQTRIFYQNSMKKIIKKSILRTQKN